MSSQAPPAQAELSYDLTARQVAFEVDEQLYPLDAIYGAAYLFIDRCYVFLSRPAEQQVRLRLRAKEEATREQLEQLAGELANELLNQVLRLRIGRSTAQLREQILARAFASSTDSTIAQLLAELDAEELDEGPLEIAVPWEQSDNAGDSKPDSQEESDG